MITNELLVQNPARIFGMKKEIVAIIKISPVSRITQSKPETARSFDSWLANQSLPLFQKQSAA